MRAFTPRKDGLRRNSLVARGGENSVSRGVGTTRTLAALFQPVAQPAAVQPAPAPQPVRPAPFFTAEGSEEPAIPSPARQEERSSHCGHRTHFIIVADMKSRSISGLEEEIFNLGPAVPIMPQAWLLASDAYDQRQMQASCLPCQKLGKLDMLFICDATHDKAAWFNFGPESDSRIRRIWQKTVEATALKRTG